MSSNISVIRGDDVTLTMTFRDSDGNAIDITGGTVFFTVKKRLSQTDAQAAIQKEVTSHSDPTNGQTRVALSKTDTDITPGVYKYDFQLRTAGGSIQSSSAGRFTVKRDVTQRIS